MRDLAHAWNGAGKGQPSVDSSAILRREVARFFAGICSERQCVRLVADGLSVLWFLKLDEPLPNHSSVPCISTRYDAETLRRFFAAVLAQCQQARLIWAKERYFGSATVRATAAHSSLTLRFAVEQVDSSAFSLMLPVAVVASSHPHGQTLTMTTQARMAT